MAQPGIRRNAHPVDRLADLRAQIRDLEFEADNLRAEIIAGGDTQGDHHIAQVVTQKRNQLSRPMLEKRFGKAAVDACCDVRAMVIVKTIPRR